MRLAVARDAGLDETTIAKVTVDRVADLPAPQAAAVALADAMMTQPGEISAALRDELRRHFSNEQLLELTLDVMKWNAQKATVALGVDDWVTPGQLTDLVYDADGNWIR